MKQLNQLEAKMDKNRPKVIAIDFDGTLVRQEKDCHLLTDFVLMPYAREVIEWMKDIGLYTILWTARSGDVLMNATSFLNRKNLILHSVNKNAPFVNFDSGPKIFYDYLIDNRSNFDGDWLRQQEILKSMFLSKPLIDEEHIIETVIKVYNND